MKSMANIRIKVDVKIQSGEIIVQASIAEHEMKWREVDYGYNRKDAIWFTVRTVLEKATWEITREIAEEIAATVA